MKNGKVTDATRIERAAPTLERARGQGRQGDRAQPFRPARRQARAGDVAEAAGRAAVARRSASRWPSPRTASARWPRRRCATLKPGDVLLLENLRFHKEEEKNDPAFVDKLVGAGRRLRQRRLLRRASRARLDRGPRHRLPAAAGRLMQAELEALDKALGNPKRPVCAVVGGAKVSTKLDLLGNLVGKVDKLIIGGGMANTFLQAQGHRRRQVAVREGPGRHRARDHGQGQGRRTARSCCRSTSWSPPSSRPARRSKVVDAKACPDDQMILDVGPKSIAALRRSRSPSARRWCGTARSAPSRSSRSTPAPWRWRATVADAAPAPEQAPVGRRRRRHGGGAGRGRRRGEVLLRLDGRRRLPGMDGRQDPARRCGADTGGVGLRCDEHAAPSSRTAAPAVGSAGSFREAHPRRRQPRAPGLRALRVHPLPEPQDRRRRRLHLERQDPAGQAGHRAAQGILDPAGRLHGAGRDDRAGRRSARRAKKPAPRSRSIACSPCTAWRASARCRSCIARGW